MCGVDAVEFQTHIAEAESSKFESFRVKFSYEDETRFDYWKPMEFTKEQGKHFVTINVYFRNCEEKYIKIVSQKSINVD